MLLSEKEFHHTLDLMEPESGRLPDPVLKGLDDWCQKTIGIRVYDYFCGCTRGGRLRVKIVLWDQNAKKKVMKGPNFDEKKQKNFAGKFAELSRKYQLNRDYQNESRLFICYDTIRDQLQHQILEMAGKELLLFAGAPDVWKIYIHFTRIHIFYETEEQVRIHEADGQHRRLQEKCAGVLTQYDVHQAFADVQHCIFTSRQTLDDQYEGSMFLYTR